MNDSAFTLKQIAFRENVLETLELISSKDKQLDYQKSVPHVDVAAELFCEWEDCYQSVKDKDWFQRVFSDTEMAALNDFDAVFEDVAGRTPKLLPPLDQFMKSKPWRDLSDGARAALSRLRPAPDADPA